MTAQDGVVPCFFIFFLFLFPHLLAPPSHHLTSIFLLLSSYFRKYNIRVEDIMVRDVRYITLNSSYRELQEMLLTGQLKTLALVESRGKKHVFLQIHF